MSERMTVEELKQVLDVLNGGTPGEICIYQSGTQTREQMLAYFAQATATHESTNLYALGIVGATSGGLPRIIAITGNGPDAEANVQRLAVAAYMAPRVINVLASFLVGVEAAEEGLSAAEGILWMAERYAESGGTSGPEMRDYDAAVERIKAGREALRKVLDGEEGE